MHEIASIAAASLFLCASSAFADDAPEGVSSSVRSYETEEKLAAMACELTAVADVGGHARLFDVAVSGKRCSSLTPQGDAVPLRVRFEPRADGWRDVVFEADVFEGTSRSELRAAVDGVAHELFERLGGAKRHTPPPVVESTDATSSERSGGGGGLRGGGIALVSVGGASVGIGAVIGFVALLETAGHAFGCGVSVMVGGSCSSQDLSGLGIAAGLAGGFGAALLITGVVVMSFAPPKSNVSAHLGPTGGSLRVTF